MNTSRVDTRFIQAPNLMPGGKIPAGEKNPGNEKFGDIIKTAISKVNGLQHGADDAVEQVMKGELGIHEGMLALQEADISLKLFIQIRNKVMDAYKEVMRMQV